MSRAGVVLLVARQELVLAVRSRWTQIFATVFALLALGVAASGYILSGGSGFQDFARTSTSLVQLVVLIVPLAALVMGVLSVAPERGAAELLFAQPVSRRVILVGKLLGLLAALCAAELAGFGVAGLVVFAGAGEEGAGGYAVIVLGAVLLTASSLSVSALLAATAVGRRRVRALAGAVVVWLFTAVLLDLVALGVASLLPSGPASRVLMLSVIVNPAAAVRTASLLAVEGTAAFGAASLALLRFTGGPFGAAFVLCGSLALWIALPALAAAHRLAKVDL